MNHELLCIHCSQGDSLITKPGCSPDFEVLNYQEEKIQ